MLVDCVPYGAPKLTHPSQQHCHNYYWLLLAESHLTRRLFGGMLARIAVLPSPAG
jgi:hypothetical protein